MTTRREFMRGAGAMASCSCAMLDAARADEMIE
jgi:hypothetical protein